MHLVEILHSKRVWQCTRYHKTLSRKKGKLTLLSRPHILLSQMVLLSEYLILNLDWTKFQENPRFKKIVAHLGERNVSCFFSFWFVVVVGCSTWRSFFFTCLPVSSGQHERFLWLAITGETVSPQLFIMQGTLKPFLNQGYIQSCTVIWIHLTKAHVQLTETFWSATPTVCFLFSKEGI